MISILSGTVDIVVTEVVMMRVDKRTSENKRSWNCGEDVGGTGLTLEPISLSVICQVSETVANENTWNKISLTGTTCLENIEIFNLLIKLMIRLLAAGDPRWLLLVQAAEWGQHWSWEWDNMMISEIFYKVVKTMINAISYQCSDQSIHAWVSCGQSGGQQSTVKTTTISENTVWFMSPGPVSPLNIVCQQHNNNDLVIIRRLENMLNNDNNNKSLLWQYYFMLDMFWDRMDGSIWIVSQHFHGLIVDLNWEKMLWKLFSHSWPC